MLKSYFKKLFSKPKPPPRKPEAPLVYNLQEIYQQLNAQYFEGKLDLQIHWFGQREFSPKRRIVLGSYHSQKKLIRIHRVLDRPHVPDYFITFIIYHEMLHHVFPPIERKNRRRQIHHRAFLEEEKRFHNYALAEEFKKTLKNAWFK